MALYSYYVIQIKLLDTDNSKIISRVYNLAGLSFSCKELTDEIKKHFNDFKFRHELDFRDKVAQSWPSSINDKESRVEWGWNPECNNVSKLVETVIQTIKKNNQY